MIDGDGTGSNAPPTVWVMFKPDMVKNTFIHYEEETSAASPLKRTMSDPSDLSKQSVDRLTRSWSKGQTDCGLDGDFNSEEPSTIEGSSQCEGRDAVSWAAVSCAQGLELSDINDMRSSSFGAPDLSWSEDEEEQAEGACKPCRWNKGLEYITISETLGSSSGDGCASVPGASWSVGADGHEQGTCKPCGWNWKPGGCSKGATCEFCHVCGPDAMKIKKKKRMERLGRIKAKQGQIDYHGMSNNSSSKSWTRRTQQAYLSQVRSPIACSSLESWEVPTSPPASSLRWSAATTWGQTGTQEGGFISWRADTAAEFATQSGPSFMHISPSEGDHAQPSQPDSPLLLRLAPLLSAEFS